MTSKQFMGLRGGKLKTAMMLLIVLPSFVLFGYNNGSTGGILTLESFVHQFPQLDTVNTVGHQHAANARTKGVVTGSYDLGAVVGSLLCIGYSDKIGRLRTILCGLLLSLIGLAIESSAYTIAQFVVGRLVVGAAIGTISAAVPVWQSECASTAHRGAYVIMEGLSISLGITISEWVDFGLSFTTTKSPQWRVPLVFPVIFALFVIPFVFFMPESPRWLAEVGRLDEARQVLAALRNEDEDSPGVQEEMEGIKKSLSIVKGSVLELAHNGEERLLHRTLLAMTGQMFQQMCGISALVFYTNTIFTDLGFKGSKSRILGACLTTFQTLCSTIPLFCVDKFGRRKLFIFTAAGLALSTAVIAGTGGRPHTHAATAAVVFVFAYDFFYPIGFLGQTFLYATELAPLRLRIPITAIANATQWLCQFVVAQVTPPGTANLGSHFWIIWACINASAVPIVYFCFPETTGRSLEEMDKIFRQSTGIFDVVRVAKTMPKDSAHHHDVEDQRASAHGAGSKEHVEEQETVGSELQI